MPDPDPHKRCFHCVLTDTPGTNGALGFISPELLSRFFIGAEMKPLEDATARATKRRKILETPDGGGDLDDPMTGLRIGEG
jgi:hypothetical protein